MSDCFDHECDAYDDDYNRNGDTFYDGGWDNGYIPYMSRGRGKTFISDPLKYHSEINYCLEAETEKAYLIHYDGMEVWVPKSICREIEDTSMYVHTDIFKKCIEGAIEKRLTW